MCGALRKERAIRTLSGKERKEKGRRTLERSWEEKGQKGTRTGSEQAEALRALCMSFQGST